MLSASDTSNPTPAPAVAQGLFAILNARIDDPDFQKERKDRAAMIKAAQDYYDGLHPQSLKVRPNDKDPNVIINLCRRIINNSVAWLFGDVESGEIIKMELEEGERQEQKANPAEESNAPDEPPAESTEPEIDPGEEWLKQVWEANGGALLLQKLGRRGSISGHGFMKVLPATDLSNDLGVPRLVLLKSAMVSVLTKEDDSDTAEAFVIEWTEKRMVGASNRLRDVRVRQIITQIGVQWVIAQFADTGRGRDKWQIESGPELWPYSWCPIVDWQNLPNDDSYYGLSDLEDLPTINNAINFTVSNVNRILFLHGHPRTVGTGFEASEVQDTAIDSFWTIPDEKAKVTNLEMQSDLGSAFAFLQFLTQQFSNIGRDLDVASLADKIGQITNYGLHVLADAALKKLGEKRLNYGRAIIQINRIFLELGGFPVQDTKLHWQHPLPEDALEEVKRLKDEREMGIVSKESAAEERGRNWQTEKDRIESEQANDGNAGEMMLRAFERGAGAQPFRPNPALRQPAAPPQNGA